jgi:mycoredoxin
MSIVTVYTRPGCPYSLRLRIKLWLRRVSFRSVNIWRDDDARAMVRSVAGGHETVPTVEVGGVWLVNPSLRAVLAARGSSRGG